MLALDALTLAVWCHRHDDPDGCMKMWGILNRLIPAPQRTLSLNSPPSLLPQAPH